MSTSIFAEGTDYTKFTSGIKFNADSNAIYSTVFISNKYDVLSYFDNNVEFRKDVTVTGSITNTALNNNISTISGLVKTANDDITSISGLVKSANDNITSRSGRLKTANDNITTISGQVNTLTNGITITGTAATGYIINIGNAVSTVTINGSNINIGNSAGAVRLHGDLYWNNDMIFRNQNQYANAIALREFWDQTIL